MSDNLYAWSDPNAGTYNEIWYLNPAGPIPVIYTKTTNPDTSTALYDANGNALDVTKFTDDDAIVTTIGIYSANSSIIALETDSHVQWSYYNRDSSRDIIASQYVSNLSDGTNTYAIKDSEARAALANKQDTLVSGTNIKTINSTSLLGSGDISIVGLPSQTSQSGKYLTTNGTTASWATIDALPSQTGQSGKYLTTNGTTASWADVDTLPSQTGNSGKVLTTNGTVASWTATGMIPFGTSTTAAATVQKEVSIPEITELNPGQVIIIQPTITSTVASSTLKLNSFDPYPMRYNNAAITTSTDSVVWSASFPSTWLFDGTYWVFLAHGLDSNSTYSINYSFDAGLYVSGIGSYAISRYSIAMQKPDFTWEKVTATTATYSTGTTKAVNTRGFLPGQIRYYGTTTNLANGAKAATNTMYEKAASVDMRYSTNCGGTTTWNTGEYIYFVGTIGADGLFYLDSTTWWTNTLPSTNDGKVYIRLGLVLTAASYTISLLPYHPIFYHDGTQIREYVIADNKQDKLIGSGAGQNIKTVNGNTLLGSGDVVIDSLPSQSGQSGKYLTTDGTDASWAEILDELPSQAGNNGKFLQTDGTDATWTTVASYDSANKRLVLS